MPDHLTASTESSESTGTHPHPAGPRDDVEQHRDPWDFASHLARMLHARPTLRETLEAVLGTAVEVCAGISAAGVNLYEHRRFEPQAVYGDGPHELDALQKRTGEGPCIEASATQSTVVIDDTTADARWPDFSARARELGIRSTLCVPLWVGENVLGSLSLYSPDPAPFAPGVRDLAELLSTQAALAIATARRSDNLLVAVDSRDVIGQAKGILMERYRITADEAFELLVASSQGTRQRVRQVAEALTSTGELPAPPPRR